MKKNNEMALSEADIELIEKHLDGNLSGDELAHFNERLSDKAFSAEVQLQKAVNASIDNTYELQLKAELKKRLVEQRKSNYGDSSSSSKYWIAAAIIGALIIVSIFLFRKNDSSPEALFVSYYKPYRAGSTTRGESLKSSPAFEAYQGENYQLAAPLLEELLSTHADISNDALIQLMLGNCYLNLNHPDKAEDNFKKVLTSTDDVLQQESEWYLALTFLKNKDIEQCRVLLMKVIDEDAIYSQRARQLLEQI